MIHSDIPADLPGIELERDRNNPSRLMDRSKSSVTKQAAAASIYDVLDAPPEDITVTRRVDDSPARDCSDNADQGVE